MVPGGIAIITDSTCDIPPELAEQYQITVLPQILVWGKREYRDRIDITPQEFYQRLQSEKELPKSTQANAQDYANLYKEACANGAREIVVLVINQGFSATHISASLGARQVNVPVYIHDSRGTSMSLGWQVLAAARAREKGGSALQTLLAAEDVRSKMQFFVCLDTIEYVYRGGRIGNARRLISNLLNAKPIIGIDHAIGQVTSIGMATSRAKAIETMYHKFFSSVNPARPTHVAVMHGEALDEANELAQRIQQEYAPAEIVVNSTCPVLGVHTGPRALALAGYSE